jgi:hypothetical protein
MSSTVYEIEKLSPLYFLGRVEAVGGCYSPNTAVPDRPAGFNPFLPCTGTHDQLFLIKGLKLLLVLLQKVPIGHPFDHFARASCCHIVAILGIQRCGTVTIFFTGPVPVLVPTFEKLWFRFWFQLLKSSCSGSYF